MRLSSSLYIRKLLASIHPPISPQSPRESKQLLNVLESAFQRHLDEKHPSPKAGHDAHHASESIPDPAQRVTHSTHSHLDTILGHPLFKQQSLTFLQTRGLAATAVKTFDNALLKKALDSYLVQSCALQYLQGREKQGSLPNKDEGLAPRLARWFNAMSAPEKEDLLLNTKHMEPLVSVMYIDGYEREVWQWLQVLYECSFNNLTSIPSDESAPDGMAYLRAEDRLVSLMIKETARRSRLQEAVQLYTQAHEYRLKSRGKSAPEPLQHSWRQVAGAILLQNKLSQKRVSAPLYNLLLRYGIPIESSPFDPAILQVYHPDSPSAKSLYQRLRSSSFVDELAKWQKSPNKLVRKIWLGSILDAAGLSLAQGHDHEAREFLQFAERTYPDFLRPHEEEADTAERLQLARQEMLVRKEFRSSGFATAPALQALV
ncbi:hypothetical protein G647_02880 [Cladophialophora carrionii CBS 160.54]|uniref:Uncharacterized protein n=1 Tax=Cladophialophora carrionii CBS 160.54 TaxID=1279043 RepID=V9DIF7_9EURO|nr:uncharacterized protein G647_02880 [Cladophialophora carrionii CBS 160.54]ETI26103.1 hypothetical protein G647_02880 [Cladophialophora carrionii CBS 160.54]